MAGAGFSRAPAVRFAQDAHMKFVQYQCDVSIRITVPLELGDCQHIFGTQAKIPHASHRQGRATASPFNA